MTRIERTNLNCSALLTIISTLGELLSENTIEVDANGLITSIRAKNKDEKTDFSLDIEPLKAMFLAFTKSPAPLLLTNEWEDYLKNLSFACKYYIDEMGSHSEYEHFMLFHDIHFSNVDTGNYEYVLLNQLCGLFRVQSEAALLFAESRSVERLVVQTHQPKNFNEIFSEILYEIDNNNLSIIFDSQTIGHTKSIDSLFSVKDLLYSRGIDVTSIAEQPYFGLQADELVTYKFIDRIENKITIFFKYCHIKIVISKILSV